MTGYHIWLVGISLVAHGLSHHEANAEICDASVCHEAAEEIISSMNRSADPCVDFYEYACGNWAANHPPPDYLIGEWNSDESFKIHVLSLLRDELLAEPSAEDIQPIQHVKEMYKLCMNKEALTSVELELILAKTREAKGWPLLMKKGTWNKDTITWQEIAQYYFNLTGSHPFYNIAQLPSSSRMENLQIYPFYVAGFENNDEYLSFMNSTMRLITNVTNSGLSDEDLQKDIDDMLNFTTAVVEAKSPGASDDVNHLLFNVSVKSLNDFLPSNVSRAKIDFGGLFQEISRVANQPSDFVEVDLYLTYYFKNLVKVLESTDERTIVNFVHWYFVSKAWPYPIMGDPFSPANRSISNSHNSRPRWVECIEKLNHSSPIIHRALMKKYFPNNLNAATDPFFTNIKNSIGATGPDSTWLSVEMKEKLNKKMDELIVSRKYPDFFDNDTAIIDYYKDLKMHNSLIETMWNWRKTSFDNLIRDTARLHYVQKAQKVMDIENPKLLWSLTGDVTMEILILTDNGNFLPPRFHESLPEYVNYGTAGSRIGMTAGHILNAEPLIEENFILNDTLTRYDELGSCLHQAQDKHPEGSAKGIANRKRILIAEYVGPATAFYAYKELKKQKYPNGELKLPGLHKFTDEQMFFLSHAQTTCGPLTGHSASFNQFMERKRLDYLYNDPSFYKTFDCPINYDKTCLPWKHE